MLLEEQETKNKEIHVFTPHACGGNMSIRPYEQQTFICCPEAVRKCDIQEGRKGEMEGIAEARVMICAANAIGRLKILKKKSNHYKERTDQL